MGCGIVKCIECTNTAKQCSMINGLCVSCYSRKEVEKKEAERKALENQNKQ